MRTSQTRQNVTDACARLGAACAVSFQTLTFDIVGNPTRHLALRSSRLGNRSLRKLQQLYSDMAF